MNEMVSASLYVYLPMAYLTYMITLRLAEIVSC